MFTYNISSDCEDDVGLIESLIEFISNNPDETEGVLIVGWDKATIKFNFDNVLVNEDADTVVETYRFRDVNDAEKAKSILEAALGYKITKESEEN